MQTVTISGGDLFHLALKHLGDATQWNRIAQANSILDPVVTGNTTLLIPPVNSKLTGGILAL